MKKRKNNRMDRVPSDFDTLNAELGSSFGLEPPKKYRPDQVLPGRENDMRKKSAAVKHGRKKNAVPSHDNKHLSKEAQIKARKKRNKLRRALSVIGVLLAVAVVVCVLSLTVFFKIDTISITGSKKYSQQEIIAVLPFEKNDNLFLINKDECAERIEQNLPYIYSVKITRKLPSTVVIKVTQASRVFAIKNSDNTYTLLDDNLKVLEKSSRKCPPGSIRIKKAALKTAVAGEKAEFSRKHTNKCIPSIINVIKDMSLDEATSIYSDGSDSNYVVYDGRITIKLGSVSGMEDKLYAALTAIEKLNSTNPTVKGEIASYGDKQVYFTEKK